MPGPRCLVRFTIFSVFDTLDLIQVVSDRLSAIGGLDEDATHWVGVSVRESVINAIKHGNAHDARKRVHVELTPLETSEARGIAIKVRDEGPGFDPEALPDPLAPENLLKSSGRGIFLIRSFMDEVAVRRAPEGGMEVLMVKRASAPNRTEALSASE